MAPLAAVAAFISVQQQGRHRGGARKRGVEIQKYYVVTTTSPHHRSHILLNVAENTHSDDVQSSNSDENGAAPNNEIKNVAKPSSPLAMAAADWLEEEDDELAMYWDRYDVAMKSSTSSSSKQQQQPIPPPEEPNTTSTEERLDRYYESRNIDRGMERKHATQIKQAIEKSTKSSSAAEAIQLLTPIRQYLQYNTKMGGNAYFELAQALDANDQGDEATDIYEKLARSPHGEVRRKSRELLAMGSARPKRTYNRNVWNWFWET
ncbi:hypothetical protein ACHAXM_004064 [Skeletonema potamos]